jgi:hypothetical protein
MPISALPTASRLNTRPNSHNSSNSKDGLHGHGWPITEWESYEGTIQMPDASNEHENAACHEGYRNTSVNKAEPTMSDQSGAASRSAGNQRRRAPNPAIISLTKAGPARRIQKLSESKQPGAHLAKVLEAPASVNRMAMTHLVPAVQVKCPRRTRDKRPSHASALCGLVPAVPIFIPAGQICQERSHRTSQREKARHPCDATDTVPLSAEILTRRWVRGKAF